MLPWVLLDDGRGEFGPLVDLRPLALVRTGASTVLERWSLAWGEPAAVVVPKHHEALCRERGLPALEALREDERCVVVNARLREPLDRTVVGTGEALLDGEGAIVAACCRVDELRGWCRGGAAPTGLSIDRWSGRPLLRRPWEILDDLPQRLAEDLVARAAAIEACAERLGAPPTRAEACADRCGDAPCVIDASATIGRGVVLDSSGGAVVVERAAHIGHGAILQGPLWVGPGTRVSERAHLKPHTSIGPACKVGGEVGGTIFQGFSNKSHEGHLGDSWIGEWVNIGAGTCNSNLLNTYGEISMRLAPDAPIERSGRRYLGAFVGDHVKFPILARIMTGSSFGLGSMIGVADPPRAVGRFRWLSDRGEIAHRFDKFIATAETVVARRGLQLSAAERARLATLQGGAG